MEQPLIFCYTRRVLPDRDNFEGWAKIFMVVWFVFCFLITAAIVVVAVHFAVKYW